MGRKDAVQFTLELAAEWRRLGARVTFEPGWETRGNGQSANYEGGNVHHTGFGSSLANPNPARTTLIGGRPDLSGPLCNSTGPACADNDPWIHIIAAHPANHAGASGGRGTAPMPVTSLFNPRSWGHEIDYGGNVAMLPGQYRAALIVGRGVATALARSTDYVRAHAETSVTGKWDPGYATGKTIDMAVFRRDAAAYQGDDMPLTDADVVKIFWGTPFKNSENFAQVIHRLDDLAVSTAARVTKLEGDVEAQAADASKTAPVSVDASAVADALAGNASFLAGLAKAVNDDAARRLAS